MNPESATHIPFLVICALVLQRWN